MVSIILPVYNVESYISDCIESIINQTSHDFELVIIDDGSKDDSISIAADQLSRSSISYKIIHRDNGGLSAARNTGIDNASGEYLCFVDSDDVIHPEYVETLLRDVTLNNVDMAIANFKWVDDVSKKTFDSSSSIGTVVDKQAFLYKILKRQVFNYFGCFMISRKYILEHYLRFDETVFFGVDQAYMWRLMVNVPQYTYNCKQIYNYYSRPGSIMTATKIDRMLTGLHSMQAVAEELANNPYFDSNYIYTRWKLSALHTIARNFSYAEFREAFPRFGLNSMDCLKYPHWKVKAIAAPLAMGARSLYYALRSF